MDIDIVRYNLIREALASPNEESDVISVPPKRFALKKEQSDEVLGCALELILNDPQIMKGITPHHSIQKTAGEEPRAEEVLYVLMAYAVASQQGWIKLSPIVNRYFVNVDHKEIVEYTEDMHKNKLILPELTI